MQSYARILIGGERGHILAGQQLRAIALARQVGIKHDNGFGAYLALGLIHRSLLV